MLIGLINIIFSTKLIPNMMSQNLGPNKRKKATRSNLALDTFSSTIKALSRSRQHKHLSKTVNKDDSFVLSDTEDTGIIAAPYVLNAFDHQNSRKRVVQSPELLKEQSTIGNSSNPSIEQSNRVILPCARKLKEKSKQSRKSGKSVLCFHKKDSQCSSVYTPKANIQSLNHRIQLRHSSIGTPHYKCSRISCYTPTHIIYRRQYNNVIDELEEEIVLEEYWQKKGEVEEKYKGLLFTLEVEEAAEIKHQTDQYIKMYNREDVGKGIMKIIASVKEEYELTRSLILKQRICEEEEVLSQYEKIVSSKI